MIDELDEEFACPTRRGIHVCVCLCVCVSKKEKERERGREKKNKTEQNRIDSDICTLEKSST